MKKSLLKGLVLGMLGFSGMVHGEPCPNLNGKYDAIVTLDGGSVPTNYGTVRIVGSRTDVNGNCEYQLKSKVQVYADPVKKGSQTLILNRSKGTGELQDKDLHVEPIDNFSFSLTGLYLHQALTGCGGEGGGAICGKSVMLERK